MAKSPPPLETIALSTLVREEWKTSKLPPLYATLAYNNPDRQSAFSFDNSKPRAEDVVRESNIVKKLTNIVKKWSEKEEIPLKIKINWAFIWEILHKKIKEFAIEMVSEEITEKDLIRSIERIRIDQSGDINKKATLLAILEDLHLSIKLPSSTLTEYGVTKGEMKSIAKKLINQVPESPVGLKKAISKEIMKSLKFFLKFWTSESSFFSLWDGFYEARSLVEKDVRRQHANKLQFAGSAKNWPGIRYYYNRIPDNKKQENLIKLAKFDMILGRFNDDMIVFLYEHMERDLFVKHVLKQAFNHVFRQLITSSQHRHLCVVFFKAALHFMEPKLFKSLFWAAIHEIDFTGESFVCKEYHRIEINNVLKAIWSLVPANLKNDEDFIYKIIPSMTVSDCNFDNMLLFLESFNEEQQNLIVAHVIINLVKENKNHKIQECHLAASRFGINIDDQQPILNKENFKKYIKNANLLYLTIMPHKEATEAFIREQNRLTEVMKYVCRTDEATEELREELINDRAFIIEIVQKSLLFNYICHFLVWLVQGKYKTVQEFIDSVTTQMWFQDDCVQKFLDSSSECNYLLQLFIMKKVDKQLVKKYPDILNKVFECLFNYDNPTRGSDLIENIYKKYVPGSKQKFYQNFFSSEEGKQAILGLFINIFEVEEDPSIRTPIPEVVRHLMGPIQIYIKKFKSVEMQVIAWLKEYGHPNNDPKNVIKHGEDRIEVSPEELPMARRIVDAYYRIFQCLLLIDHEITLPRYMRNLTEFSVELANSLGLDIPVVL